MFVRVSLVTQVLALSDAVFVALTMWKIVCHICEDHVIGATGAVSADNLKISFINLQKLFGDER